MCACARAMFSAWMGTLVCVVPKTRVCGSTPLVAAALWGAPHSCIAHVALLVLYRTACAGSCYWSLQGPRSFGSRRHCASSARVQASGLKVYIYKFLYICACALLLFLLYYLLLPSVLTTCALYSHYIKFCYLCAAVIRMLLYLFVSFISNLYLFTSR